jgi:mono/diheme cytochrome c family protein
MTHRRLGAIAALSVLSLLTLACGGAIDDAGNDAVLQGEVLYAEHCQVCHGIAATGEGRIGAAPSHGPSGHTWHHPDAQLEDIVLGRFTYPGRTMPSFQGILSEENARAVLAYIKTGWTEEQRQYQTRVSEAWEQQQRQ